MSRKKGLSYEEKRTRLKELLQETKDVFTLKELETLAKREKGIVSQTVKDIAQSLIDDGEINMDKIGTSNYYWSFPSQDLVVKTNIIKTLTEDIHSGKRKHQELEAEHAQLLRGREESEERSNKLRKLQQLQEQKASMQEELQKYAEFDPEMIEDMEKDAEEAKEAANRWTDNIFSLKSWCQANFNMEANAFYEHFQLKEDFDSLP